MGTKIKSLTLDSYAKINLALDVIGKRPDGYHDVELIFNEISLCDTITLTLTDDGEIKVNCSDSGIPADQESLTYRAAAAFLKKIDSGYGVEINLINRIPNGAGLAGASADAAGVLKGLNALTEANLTQAELMEIGAKLGADVPFCIMGGCALAEGIGEVLTPLPAPPKMYYVIAKPEVSVSTAWVYQNLDLNNRPEKLCVQAVAEGIRRGDIEMIVKNSDNILESVTAGEFPVINDLKRCFSESGAILSLMSGSGTSVFGAFERKEDAHSAVQKAKEFTENIYIV